MVSEAGTKAVKVDGLFCWLPKLSTVKHIITKEISKKRTNSSEVLYQQEKDMGLRVGNRALGSLQIPNQAIMTQFCHICSSFWAWAGNSNIYKMLLWTPLFHQWFQCEEAAAQSPYSITGRWAQLSAFAVPYHYTISLKWVWWRKSLDLTKPRILCHTWLFLISDHFLFTRRTVEDQAHSNFQTLL